MRLGIWRCTAGGQLRPKSRDWDELLSYVAANLGWDFDTILNQMTFERFAALQKEWERRPPAHWLIAQFLGYEPPQKQEYMTRDAFADFMERTGGRIEGVQPR